MSPSFFMESNPNALRSLNDLMYALPGEIEPVGDLLEVLSGLTRSDDFFIPLRVAGRTRLTWVPDPTVERFELRDFVLAQRLLPVFGAHVGDPCAEADLLVSVNVHHIRGWNFCMPVFCNEFSQSVDISFPFCFVVHCSSSKNNRVICDQNNRSTRWPTKTGLANRISPTGMLLIAGYTRTINKAH